MIDFHSHILPGIDDGSRNLEQSIYMVNEAKNVGFTKIISTSHYMENYYECNEQERKRLLKEVQDSVDGIELYLGNEIYITNNMIDLLKNGQASSINNTRYVLFEFPLINTKPMNDKEVIYRLIENGYIPIIAHPERYMPFIKKPSLINDFIKEGYLFQLNTGSIVGDFGKEVKKLALNYLGNGVYYICGSDAHSDGKRNTHISEDCLEILSNYKDEFIKNGQLILEDKEVKRKINLIKERKKLFGIF